MTAASIKRRARAGILGKRRVMAIILLLCLNVGLAACAQNADGLKDGYYTAQAEEFDHGWQEFLTICVSNGKIITAEYQAKTPAGFIKSWDMQYMRTMNAVSGTYPNEYVRVYTRDFLERQNPEIDAITGASTSYNTFKLLAAAVIERAKQGDTSVAIVRVPETPPEN